MVQTRRAAGHQDQPRGSKRLRSLISSGEEEGPELDKGPPPPKKQRRKYNRKQKTDGNKTVPSSNSLADVKRIGEGSSSCEEGGESEVASGGEDDEEAEEAGVEAAGVLSKRRLLRTGRLADADDEENFDSDLEASEEGFIIREIEASSDEVDSEGMASDDTEDILMDIAAISKDWSDAHVRKSKTGRFQDLIGVDNQGSESWFREIAPGEQSEGETMVENETPGPSEPDTDEEADQILFWAAGLSQDDDSQDDDDDYDGDTTDSLDDADEIALIRFGIETESGVGSGEEGDYTVDMTALAEDPSGVIASTAASLNVDEATAARILTGVGVSFLMQRDVDSTPVPALTEAPPKIVETQVKGPPQMGTFVPKLALGDDLEVIVDGSSIDLPSPYNDTKKASSVSRRDRGRNSIMPSSPSLSTPVTETEPVLNGPVGPQMQLNDVLEESIYNPHPSPSSSPPSELDGEIVLLPDQLADLTRWDRVPISAFRNTHGESTDRAPPMFPISLWASDITLASLSNLAGPNTSLKKCKATKGKHPSSSAKSKKSKKSLSTRPPNFRSHSQSQVQSSPLRGRQANGIVELSNSPYLHATPPSLPSAGCGSLLGSPLFADLIHQGGHVPALNLDGAGSSGSHLQ